jgi:hypothetical protein
LLVAVEFAPTAVLLALSPFATAPLPMAILLLVLPLALANRPVATL